VATQTIDEWLEDLAGAMPDASIDEVGPPERAALLELARIAAHRSHRTAAPITTYLVGLSLASLPRDERRVRLRALADTLASEF
jgi:hypothetical protein